MEIQSTPQSKKPEYSRPVSEQYHVLTPRPKRKNLITRISETSDRYIQAFQSKLDQILHRKASPNVEGFTKTLSERLRERNSYPELQFRWKSGIIFGTVFFGILFIISLIYFWIGVYQQEKLVPEYISALSQNQPTKILDRNGDLVSELFGKRVSDLDWGDYPDDLKKMLLLVEDRDFYQHGALDYLGIIRAMWVNFIHFGYRQGASTITQQLARILIQDREKTLSRKWKEAQLAFALENVLTKEEILLHYMNQVYLGHGAFGFGSASEFYFRKKPLELTIPEMLVLSSLASAPNRYSPIKHPDNSRIRTHAIIVSLEKKGIINGSFEGRLLPLYQDFMLRSPSETVFGNREDNAPYVTEHVRKVLESLFPDRDIYSLGGFVVKTTLIGKVQAQVEGLVQTYIHSVRNSGKVRKIQLNSKNSNRETALENRLSEVSLMLDLFLPLERKRKKDQGLQAAIVGIDPGTGAVLFWHGGATFGADNQFDRVYQMYRQTGSSIKPIIYGTAIQSGIITPSTKILDAPLLFGGDTQRPEGWTPENFGDQYSGEISVREALAKSKNTAAIQVAEDVGLNGLQSSFQKFFFPDKQVEEKRFRKDLSISLGSLEISPLEMASAYSSFANSGEIRRPHLIDSIQDKNGKNLYSYREVDEFGLFVPESRQAIRPAVSEIMIDLMQDSADHSGVRAGNYKGIVAGKTGTTNDYKDAWFVGLTPGMSMAVWLGYDDPSYSMGGRALGGTLAAPLWGKIARIWSDTVKKRPANFQFQEHAVTLEVCKESGLLKGPNCSHTYKELFLPEYQPRKVCPMQHVQENPKSMFRSVL